MGAKTPTKLKLRRPTYKCDICQRKLLSAQALKTHQYCVHKIQDSSVKPVKPKAKKVEKPVIKPKPTSKLDDEEKEKDLSSGNVSDVRKIEFECPVCNIMFPAYFSAYRHIQKWHSVNFRGQKVESTSVELIKPLRVEMCVKCNKRVRANEHSCFEMPVLAESGYGVEFMCTGCQQKFSSMQLFDLHVSGLHSEGVESMFFPNMNEFLTWKLQMQTKTNMNYLILGKCNTKQTYRCTYLSPTETMGHNSISHICPSSIVVQEFTKGIQVHFYKKHQGHQVPEYSCPDKYKKFLITSLMQDKGGESYDVTYDEKDMYCQFKILLESIIIEAAKVKVSDLKLMLEKALEMTAILNNYDEDDDTLTSSSKNNLRDDEISKALDSLNKRKTDIDHFDPMNHKSTPKIVNAFSMASNKEEKRVTVKKVEPGKTVEEPVRRVEEVKKQELPSPRILRNSQIQSPTFNDTYQDFVKKNFKQAGGDDAVNVTTFSRIPRNRQNPLPKPVENTKKSFEDKEKGLRVRPLSKLIEPCEIEKELEKDFIEVPLPTVINKNLNTVDPNLSKIGTGVTVKRILPNENKGLQEDPKDFKADTVNSEVNTKVKGPVIKKDFTPRVKDTKPKKQIMKTKIGQFKQSISPKSSISPKPSISPKKPDSNRSFERIKPDIEYEVMEQENDCNILILKI